MATEYQNPIAEILLAERLPPDWLIPELWLKGAVYVLAGESGAGKSSLSYTIGLAIASGCPALSGIIPASEPQRVVYFDQENSEQDRNEYLRRAHAGLAWQNRQEPDIGLLLDNFWPVHFHLGSDDWLDRATEWIDFVQPACVFFDTANSAFNIVEENNNGIALTIIKDLRMLIRRVTPTATAIVMKHAKTRTEKGQVRTVRGAKGWKDSTDGMLFQCRTSGRPRKDGLALTRLVPDKVRAYGLRQTIYITPQWTDSERNGLSLGGSYAADKSHKAAEEAEEE